MDNIAEQLKQVKVIDEKDIINFKNYIYKKYPQNTSVQNAKILSDTIHQIIDIKLEGLPQDSKISIKDATLKNTLGNNKKLITLYDIFDSCVIDEALEDKFIKHLINWVSIHTKNTIDINKFNFYLQSKTLKNEELNNQLEKNIDIESEEICVDSILSLNDLNSKSKKSVVLDFLANLNNLKFYRSTALISALIAAIFLGAINNGVYLKIKKAQMKDEVYISKSNKICQTTVSYPNSHLPEYMRYRTINEEKLKSFLDKHNSILSKEPYFSTIFSVAKEFNLNPIVLFSITGQEQSFVPKNIHNAAKIANNPFNVYHSWEEYNTNIKDTSSIAARTVINLSKDMPKNADPFLWIGKDYAEDKEWGKGVEAIFKELSEYVN